MCHISDLSNVFLPLKNITALIFVQSITCGEKRSNPKTYLRKVYYGLMRMSSLSRQFLRASTFLCRFLSSVSIFQGRILQAIAYFLSKQYFPKMITHFMSEKMVFGLLLTWTSVFLDLRPSVFSNYIYGSLFMVSLSHSYHFLY